MNFAQVIDPMLVRSRAIVAPRVLPRPNVHLGKVRRKAILDALAGRPCTFAELRTITRYRRDSQLSAMLSNLRREKLIGHAGPRCHQRYHLTGGSGDKS
jgi:hypothetical protein